MTKQEYADYEDRVANFFKREGITNLTGGHLVFPNCKVPFEDEYCPGCNTHRQTFDEPFFSWKQCDCCGTNLGGNREYANGYNPTTKGIQEYIVCEDCVYYSEYGRLDNWEQVCN